MANYTDTETVSGGTVHTINPSYATSGFANITLVNLGPGPVYVSTNSTVPSGQSMALNIGESCYMRLDLTSGPVYVKAAGSVAPVVSYIISYE